MGIDGLRSTSAISTAGFSVITPTSIANSGGSASASNGLVTFTGVSSISINGVFSGDFPAYRVVISQYTPSASSYLNMRLRASDADRTGNTYAYQFGSFNSTTVAGARSTAQSSMRVLYATISQYSGTAMDIFAPDTSNKTQFFSMMYMEDQVPTVLGLIGGWESTTSAADGLSLIPASGTCTGVVSVYGYV